jgi:PelA/Pel-15E family pectate lyase
VKSALVALLTLVTITAQEPATLRDQATNSLRRAVEFFRGKVAVEGAYLWQYSEDLSLREGENAAPATRAWVQPPGSPSVGIAFLQAHQATRDPYYLDAARETAHGLLRGQLRSGGWTYSIDFSNSDRRRYAYRDSAKNETSNPRNVTTFDDDTTQAALRFLIRLDRAQNFSDSKIHEAIDYCITSIIKAQYQNGAWPQGYDHFPDPEKFPITKAAYPEAWSRTWPGAGQYWYRYTLNDNSHATIIDTLIEAAETYQNTQHTNLAQAARAAINKAGDFILLAQMPGPQPAWAQQYDFDMHPSWARKFEPPSISAGESQHILRALFQLHNFTADPKYLEPIPRALAYLRTCRLSDGRLARFYELKTNKPLYFTRDYQLTYNDTDLPTHYAFKIHDTTQSLQREYESLKKNGPAKQKPKQPILSPELQTQVKTIIAAQDTQGRWLEPGPLKTHPNTANIKILRAATFNRNLQTLSDFLAASPVPNKN